MVTAGRILASLDRLRTEWAIEGAEKPKLDAGWTPDFAYGVVHGRDQALQLIRQEVEQMLAAEEGEDDGGKS